MAQGRFQVAAGDDRPCAADIENGIGKEDEKEFECPENRSGERGEERMGGLILMRSASVAWHVHTIIAMRIAPATTRKTGSGMRCFMLHNSNTKEEWNGKREVHHYFITTSQQQG